MVEFGKRYPPIDHAASHENAGSDEISLAGLSGELATDQPPKAHDLAGAIHNADTLADLNTKVSNATLDDSGDTRTPAAHKTSHQDGGTDEIDATGLVGRINYVERGDPSSPDVIMSALTTDGTWRDISFSGIVPAGAVAIHLTVNIEDDVVENLFSLRKNGLSNTAAASRLWTAVANDDIDMTCIVLCDADRVIEYWSTNTTWTRINLTVLGWFI